MQASTSATCPARLSHRWRRVASFGSGLLAALSILVVLPGCGADSDWSRGEDPAGRSASPSADGLKISGVVVLDTQQDSPNDEDLWTLRTFDPDSGENLLNLSVPAEGSKHYSPAVTSASDSPVGPLGSAQARAAFSPDWQYAAWSDHDGAIHVLRLDPEQRAYVPYRVITPEGGSYSGGAVEYDIPWFNPDDERLWFEATPSEGPTKIMSVDHVTARSGGKEISPREEGELNSQTDYWQLLPAGFVQTTNRGGDEDMLLLDGEPVSEIGEPDSDEHLLYAEADGAVAGGRLELEGVDYEFVGAVDDRTMLMRADPLEDAGAIDRHGEVVTVRVDEQGKRITVESVTEKGADMLHGIAIAPDQKRVVLVTEEDSFLEELGSAEPPEPASVRIETSDTVTEPVLVLGWG